MNLIKIILNYARQRWLYTSLNVLLLGLGLSLIFVTLSVFRQVEENFYRNTKNIDMVVGAEGSPLQLVLSSVYHIDVPTGNISLSEAQKITQNKLFVKKAIPISLGDNFRGFRIVGTTQAYPDNYQARLQSGVWWKKEMEAVLGLEVARAENIKIGDTFVGGHGTQNDGNEELLHKDKPYKVVGIMQKTNTVLDKLVLTGLESIWHIHEAEEHHDHEAADKEITALLIEFGSPMAAINLPRQVDALDNMQSAIPMGEVARFLSIVGIGAEALKGLGYVLLAIAMLGVFIGIYNSVRERRYDLAVMRALGASKLFLFGLIIFEGLFIATLGVLVGLLLGHLGLELLAKTFSESLYFDLTGFFWVLEEFWLIGFVLLMSVLISAVLALRVYKIDVIKLLQ
jgi:putative ABC transport system permease protein